MDLFIWHRSIMLTGAGLATLLANTQVFWVAVCSALFLSERLTPRFAICALGAVVGIAMLTVPGLIGATLSGIGTLLGLGTAVFYALYILTLRASQQHPAALPIVPNLAISSGTSAVVLLAGAYLTGEAVPLPDAPSLGLLVVLAVVVQISGWLFISKAMPHLPARISSLIILLQPVLATVWGVLIFAEQLNALDALGGMVTLVAIYAATAWQHPKPVLNSAANGAQPDIC
jgi:drug/metabolite transporter (DMT)-like permease